MKSIPVSLPQEITEKILGLVASPSIVISELVKNSIDSNSEEVTIKINTTSNSLLISDIGDGLSESAIIDLGTPGTSTKKNNDNIRTKDGYYLAGNKGLGILSAFSLSDLVEITTTHNNKTYFVKWQKATSKLEYSEIQYNNTKGTSVLIKNISSDNMKILTDSSELSKLRHMTNTAFEGTYSNKSIKLYINDTPSDLLTCCNINEIDDKWIYKIAFNYNSKDNTLNYKFKKADLPGKINKTSVNTDRLLYNLKITLSNDINLSELLLDNYGINKYIPTNDNLPFNYLESDLEDFYGEFYVFAGTPGKILRDSLINLGYGVKVFVNNFAMYSYLDKTNDWLSFSQMNQVIKFTSLKLHNVYGFINFNELNEKASFLQITNERANFIENAAYKKFIEIVKYIVVQVSFNIDIAYRNNYIIEDFVRNSHSSSRISVSPNDNPGATPNDNPSVPPNDNPGATPNDNPSVPPNDNPGATPNDNPSATPNDNPSATPNDNPGSSPINPTRKKKNIFFINSTVLKSENPINLEYSDLINQLRSLDYDNYYLLYNMSFRTILEDIYKRYLIFRNKSLNGDFSLNVKNMCIDIISVVNTELDQVDKDYIYNHLGGFNAFKNYFQSTADQFHKNGAQGSIGSQLNSLTHTPRRMPLNDALLISNDIIPPLYFACKEIMTRLH